MDAAEVQGGQVAAKADEDLVVGAGKLRDLEQLERLLGRKPLKVEVLKEALTLAREGKPVWQLLSLPRPFPGESRR